jgi:nucleoside-diphosphate-sugar epimerase
MRATVVGGTGPTGVPIVNGLAARGYDVTVFHTGAHETPDLVQVAHVHGDPTDPASISEVFRARDVDLIVALYGRARCVADAAAGRCARFVSISGLPVYAGYVRGSGARLPIPVREDAPLVASNVRGLVYPSAAVRAAEDHVLELGTAGAFSPTIVRYPVVYGRRVHHNFEWLTIRRVLEGATSVVLPYGGAAIHSRVAVDNAAACVLITVDRGDVADGRVYNVADDDHYTLREWVEATARFAGGELQIIDGMDGADDYEGLGRGSLTLHAVVDTSRARAELGHRDVVRPMDALRDAVEWALVRYSDRS